MPYRLLSQAGSFSTGYSPINCGYMMASFVLRFGDRFLIGVKGHSYAIRQLER